MCELRPHLPAQAFAVRMVGLRADLPPSRDGGRRWVATRHVPHVWWPVLGLVVGNSVSILSFYAHDVTHRSVTTNKYLLYPTELLLWGLIFVPASLWRRVHGTHHAHTNGDDDPDRRFLAQELTPVGLVAAATTKRDAALQFRVPVLLDRFVAARVARSTRANSPTS
jgi:fatty acid desaturase